jgi:hypothetical protein
MTRLPSIILCAILTIFLAGGCTRQQQREGEEAGETVVDETGEAAEAVAEETAAVADEIEDAVDDETTVELSARANSGVLGAADLRPSGDSTRIEIELTEFEADTSYSAYLENGPCGADQGHAASLGTLVEGEIATTVPAGTISDGASYSIEITDADGNTVACGDLPAGGSP